MARPKVSIVIPYFNQEAFVLACLESVLSQSFADWEAIVVDDASTEGDIGKLVQGLHDRRLHVLRHGANRGQGAARNTGFRGAGASIVLPLDADDMLHADFLSAAYEPFSESPDTDCAFTDFRLFGSDEEVWHHSARGTMRDMLLRQWIPGAGTLMRRAVWERAGGYCEEPILKGNEDWDFWITALSDGLRVVHIPRPLYLYRRHDESMSSFTLPYRDHSQRELIYRRHKALFDGYELGGEFRARGYLNSAAFSWAIGERRRALRVSIEAFRRRAVALPFLTMTARSAAGVALARGRRARATL